MELAPSPVRIENKKDSRELEIEFENGATFLLTHELLRVYSPSAEVRGHSPAEHTLQTGKRQVAVTKIEPQGNYAVTLTFDDGHDTGIYTWEWLWELCQDKDAKWETYLAQLEEAGASRDPA